MANTTLTRWIYTSEPTTSADHARDRLDHRQVVFGSNDRSLVKAWADRHNTYVIAGRDWFIARIDRARKPA